MASLVWTSILFLLYFELALVFILVVPVPRKIRNFIAKEIAKFNIGERLVRPVLYLGILLGMALVESYWSHQRILDRISEESSDGVYSRQHDRSFHAQDRERKFKSERNMYLAGFSLTLLFVIGRITRLMQESVELEEETERVEQFVTDSKEAETKQAPDKKKD
mmetsp:Transcript_108660/g.162540  ORF Transcript_108660/g.162540 Transcript_108660/m.162540 type:complete len:164 (-) Transcript_108660:28-519(-)|eukprot:CAMPEP_0117038084 /NCGR_PEP_ID=MMETSP0472-20121206/26829_1 /TAXON_ID=693140 ORGANISM="Tiarina fusus, Strain LIS" /NCGR_SAMPLE_ID=MMETSP0472 /ASSEMBLY_ACC=CAM_ASM_000603 /LENGTH=163 /DNA_ID=CAMNT_0004748229 /DNA_START=255 /DNA_END=746 /DNA_ORIENTATION=-